MITLKIYTALVLIQGVVTFDTISAPDISTMQGLPTIAVEFEINHDGRSGQLVHYCDFTPDDASLFYRIEWSLTSKLSKDQLLLQTEFLKFDVSIFRKITVLTESHLKANGVLKLGYTIMCAVRAKADLIGEMSRPAESRPKFCGFEVEPLGSVTIKQAEIKDIQVRLTVPLPCYKLSVSGTFTSPIDVVVHIPKKSHDCKATQLVVGGNEAMPCGTRLRAADVGVWKNISVAILAVDVISQYSVEYGVFLVSVSEHPFYNVALPPIRVVTEFDNTILSNKRCYAYSDVNMMTFDGRPFSVKSDMTAIMYRNRKYRQEIRTGKCPTFATNAARPYCVEAVAIAAGRDVFIVDPLGARIGYRLCGDGVLHRKIKRLGDRAFEVYLPTGTTVKIGADIFENFLKIDVYPSLPDWTTSDGLCGQFDGISSNDGDIGKTLPFLLSEISLTNWRITTANRNLFKHESDLTLFPWDNQLKFCDCSPMSINHIMSGNFDETVVECKADSRNICYEGKNEHLLRCDLARRKRHQLDIHELFETNFFQEDMTYTKEGQYNVMKRRLLRRFTQQQYNESSARIECAQAINTTLAQMCLSLPYFKIDTYLNNCVSDLLISDSLDWPGFHFEEMRSACIRYAEFNQPIPLEVRQNLSASVDWMFNDTDGTTVDLSSTLTFLPTTTNTAEKHNTAFSPEILQSIKDITCPEDCNGHGSCIKGECKCNDGYFDIDCGQDMRKPPLMVGIPDLGLCDLTKRECAVTSVLGRNFINTSSLSCKLLPYEISTGGHTIDHPVVLNGRLVTYVKVRCKLPLSRGKRSTTITNKDRLARGYRVSVSNDGYTFCEDDPIVIYDSTCVNCSKHKGVVSCLKLHGFCMRNGRCVHPEQTHECRTCQLDASGNAVWVTSADCVGSVSNLERRLWIIATILGPASILVVIVAAIYCTKFPNGDNKRNEMDSVDPVLKNDLNVIKQSCNRAKINIV